MKGPTRLIILIMKQRIKFTHNPSRTICGDRSSHTSISGMHLRYCYQSKQATTHIRASASTIPPAGVVLNQAEASLVSMAADPAAAPWWCTFFFISPNRPPPRPLLAAAFFFFSPRAEPAPVLLLASASSIRRTFSLHAFFSTYASTKSPPPIMAAIASALVRSLPLSVSPESCTSGRGGQRTLDRAGSASPRREGLARETQAVRPGKLEDKKMVHKELPQAWWFGSFNRAKPTGPSPWLSNTLSELDEKTKQMLNLIEQDADSFAQRAEMYYKRRPILVDMLGDLYRAHRSLAEQYDLLKHSSGTRHTMFGMSSCMQSRPQTPPMNSGKTAPGWAGSSCSLSAYDSESEVDDPEQEEPEEEVVSETETDSEQQQQQQEHVELLRAEIEKLKEQNAALQKVAEENAALKAELAGKDEEKREVIRQLASSFVMMREENRTLRDRVREPKTATSPRAFDLKKVAKDLFPARLFFGHCRATGPIVAL